MKPNSVLDKLVTLKLNRFWMAIDADTPRNVLVDLCKGTITALDIHFETNSGEPVITPRTWEDWITLPVRQDDFFVRTRHVDIRIPVVCVCVEYDKIPQKFPRLTKDAIASRQNYRCAYTGKLLKKSEGNIDHIVPVSRGGKNSWENMVWSDREINTLKADKLPSEVGLHTPHPKKPNPLPISSFIHNKYDIREWRIFLNHE